MLAYPVKIWLDSGKLGVKHIGKVFSGGVSGHIIWPIDDICNIHHLHTTRKKKTVNNMCWPTLNV